MQQIFLALPERDDFVFVIGGPGLLEPVDFPLHVGALPVVPQALEGPDTIGRVCRAPLPGGRFPDQRGLSFT